MEYMGCYNSVMEIVDEATEQFSKTHKLNVQKKESLRDICEQIDCFAEDIECNFVDVNVDMSSKQLTIDIGCDDIILHDGRNNNFFSLIQMFDSFSFSKTKCGGLCVALNINDVWERLRG